MGRPFNTDGRQTRQAILDASLALFAEHGFNGTSLRDIARAVGVRESAFYNYFPGKDAIFTGILDAAKEHRAQQLETFLLDRGLRNYWGYNTLAFFAPHGAYSATGTHGEQVREFKDMVKALHRAGIEVLLDVVYNQIGRAHV